MIPALTIIPLALVAFIIWRERQYDKQTSEQAQAFRLERIAWAEERRDLNNRIQAPEAAPYMDIEGDPEPQHVPFDDDAAFLAEAEKLNYDG